MTRYAETTKVPVERSRDEVMALLTKHGVTAIGWQKLAGGDSIMFSIDGGAYRFDVIKPSDDELAAVFKRLGRPWYGADDDRTVRWRTEQRDQEHRRRWRATILLMKAKFEAIASGDTTLARELLPYRLLADGRTMEETVMAGNVPMLAAGR